MAAFHVTDLNTLQYLTQDVQDIAPAASTILGYPARAITQMQTLCLVWRFPFQSLLALEQPNLHVTDDACATWLQLCPAIARLKKLRNLQLWADHDGKRSWTAVNERAFLDPLHTLTHLSRLHISVSLPMLHPKYESPDRHFVPKCSPPPFSISRRVRQRAIGINEGGGWFDVKFLLDFPITYRGDPTEDIEGIEQSERKRWEEGEDVEVTVRQSICNVNLPGSDMLS
jgi:hypothetical protein